MNTETITATAELITATAAAATALSPYASQLITLLVKAIKALHSKTTKPRARHRQGKGHGRHTK
ncbi:hypothetical protein [Arthrobacter glacialis]|uniref:Uncharacterized protein n=1 Tax=Arthrobacter glacialis TaxID=1664 RepID=A0A2S3ZUM6_ARTGL|nr:hypothetical protein [Arthrobacter glacialis]POH72557.1 hypothetical protein CVS27_15680 [Arthrobacter glacialis]